MLDSSTVVFLGLNYAPEPTGNAPYTASVAAGLAAEGKRVEVHTAHPHYPEWRIRQGYGGWTRRERLDGVELIRRRHYVPDPPRGVWRLLSEVSFGLRLLFARLGRPDVIVAVSPALFATAIALLRKPRVPRVVWVQDLYALGLRETGEGGGLAARVTRWVESRTLRRADRVVVIHERFADYVTRELGVDPARVVVIRNWTHLPVGESIDRATARRRLSWSEDEVIALHAGNMGAKQGLENVVEAARLADARGVNLRFLMVGGGGERAALEELAAGVERIAFVDPVPDAEFRAALAAADVLLVNERPGVAEMAVPSKLTSYFDAGRPVVAATADDGITASELRAADAGVIVPAGEPAALLDAIIELAADLARSARLGMNGRRYRETILDQSAAIANWSALIEEVVAAKVKR